MTLSEVRKYMLANPRTYAAFDSFAASSILIYTTSLLAWRTFALIVGPIEFASTACISNFTICVALLGFLEDDR